MPKLAEVHTLYEANARSISDMLRKAADSIDVEGPDDVKTTAIIAVQLNENGAVKIYGWGETNNIHALGVLQMGIHELLTMGEV